MRIWVEIDDAVLVPWDWPHGDEWKIFSCRWDEMKSIVTRQ